MKHEPPFYSTQFCYLTSDSLLIFFFFFLMIRRPPNSPLFPYPPLFRSPDRTEPSSILWALALGCSEPPLRHLQLRAARPAEWCWTSGEVDWRVGSQRDEHLPERLSFQDRKSTRLNSSHSQISYAVFCLK